MCNFADKLKVNNENIDKCLIRKLISNAVKR